MANYIVSYDLNGPKPTHHEMDKHMEGAGWNRARILETVWWVGTDQTRKEVLTHIRKILSKDDQVIVASSSGTTWHNLLVTDDSFKAAFEANG